MDKERFFSFPKQGTDRFPLRFVVNSNLRYKKGGRFVEGEQRFSESNLIFLAYISEGLYKRVPKPEDLYLDLSRGLWRCGLGPFYKIGEAVVAWDPKEDDIIGVFDRTNENHMQTMYQAERFVASH